MSNPRWQRQLVRLYEEQNGLCCYCDGATWLPRREDRRKALARLGIPVGTPGTRKLIRAAVATREHILRRADGGKHAGNVKMACGACNTLRDDHDPDVHRADMQALVRAGFHPTNRPKTEVEDVQRHYKAGLKALRNLRAGIPLEEKP